MLQRNVKQFDKLFRCLLYPYDEQGPFQCVDLGQPVYGQAIQAIVLLLRPDKETLTQAAVSYGSAIKVLHWRLKNPPSGTSELVLCLPLCIYEVRITCPSLEENHVTAYRYCLCVGLCTCILQEHQP